MVIIFYASWFLLYKYVYICYYYNVMHGEWFVWYADRLNNLNEKN